jgi:hypothetical protein
MDMPFYFFFGLLGLAAGALVVWLLLAEHPFEGPEPPIGPVDKVEATLLAAAMAKRGRPVDEETVVDLIELHTAYIEGRISEELELTEADRNEAARAKAEAEAAQTGAQVDELVPAVGEAMASPATGPEPARPRAIRAKKAMAAAQVAAPDAAVTAPSAVAPSPRTARAKSKTSPEIPPAYDTELGSSEQK